VRGWDDARMPTIAGYRRRGYTPEAIREFCAKIGVAKNISTVDIALLEHTVRDDLDPQSPRVMCVLRPIELVVESYPENEVEDLEAPYWPQGTVPKPGVRAGSRKLPFSRTLYIDRDDFAADPPPGWHRLAPGREVRLRHAYIVRVTGLDRDDKGDVVRIRCTHDPATRGGTAPAGKRIEGTIHWVSAAHAKDVEVRLYDRLFSVAHPGADGADPLQRLNPHSLTALRAKAEPSVAKAKAGDRYQFERVGYFFTEDDSKPGAPVFNRTVHLKDSWQKVISKAESPTRELAPSRTSEIAAAMPKEGRPAELSPEAIALRDAHGIAGDEARVLTQEPLLRPLFDETVRSQASAVRGVASLLVNDVLGELRAKKLDAVPFDAQAAVELLALVDEGAISNNQKKDVLAEMFASKTSPRAIVEARGMKQIANADALAPVVDAVLAKNADAVGRYKSGNANVLGALVGMVMKETKGQANPKLVTDLLKQKLG